MAGDFARIRDAFLAARRDSESGRTALIRAVEKVKRLEREEAALARRATEQGENAALAALRAQLDDARIAVRDLKTNYTKLVSARGTALDHFVPFTDPITQIEALDDSTPIALFPLRIETRYRTLARAGGQPRRVFCVRVFPDDVLVDTFQPEISETELTNVTNYWIHRWRAGGDEAGHRAAWASLVRSHGAGRAIWLIEQMPPANPEDEPIVEPGEHILVVLPPAPVPDAEQPEIAKFWARVWSTGGAERDAAFAGLEAALGAARAAEVEAELVPVNFGDVAVKPSPSIVPRVVFLDLPAAGTLPLSQDSWTRGARAWLLPERLVLLGFRAGKRVLIQLGEPIPPDLQIGPDPSAADDEQIKAGGEDMEIPEGLRWTVDFDEAVAKGMAFTVNVDDDQSWPEYDRLFVLGVRLGSDANEAAGELSELIRHHQASRKGFAILPQGRATNNTDASTAGYTWWEDPDESFRHFFESDPNDDPDHWERRKDGPWLAGMLGIDRKVLLDSVNYYGTDQAEARAMNTALWPATLGYYMEQMMEPVFSEETVRNTRAFFNRFVIGRGTVPLIRVGRQPYGILPATVWSRMEWWNDAAYARTARANGLPDPVYLRGLFDLVRRAATLWGDLARNVAHAGNPGEDPQQTLLSIVGLHPVSAEFYQRFARSFTHYYNMLHFSHVPAGGPGTGLARRYIEAGLLALSELGWNMPPRAELPELLEKIFLGKANLLKGHLVQAEVSDAAPLAITRADGLNYIAWLQSAARTSHDVLRRQEGFAGGVPQALLYQMLRHALDLGFVDAALELRRTALQMPEATYRVERKEPKYIHVAEQDGRSRWEPLYRAEPAVTGDPALRLGDYIPKVLESRDPYLNAQLAALDVLKTAPTGALERALVEHLDCLTYRLDAWWMGIQAVQLSHMRGETAKGFTRSGIYVGAYGWLENVKPKQQTLTPVELSDPKLAEIFHRAGEPPLVRDSTNFGHIHAPSLDHAVTAAILRNGHLANATPAAPDLLAVDLTSERVRLAQQILEGIRNGQSLGALLGYRLERALHDEPDLFLDRLIYDLRRAFPLAGNRNLKTKVAVRKITSVEARNVVDGAAFVDHIDETGATTYPYGLSDLPPLSDFTGPGLPAAAQIGSIIDRHVAELRSVTDAVADLQIAESVYQVVRGNYDRASGTLDAFSKGATPPLPEVVTTPRNGRTLTHRIGLHLQGGLSPADPANTTPRAKGEPALARWLARQLPDPANVFARVTWRDETAGADVSLTPSMAALGLSAVDLFYMVDAGGERDMPRFDDLLIDFAERTGAPAPRHDAIFSLEYKPAGVAGPTLFEVAPLIRALRGLLLGARPLRPSDLALQNEASSGDDAGILVRIDKVQAVVAGLQGTLAAVDAFIATLEASIGDGVDPELARDAARDNVDQWMAGYAAIVRPVVPFGLQAASLTTGVEGRRAPFTAMLAAIIDIIVRWEEKADAFDEVMQNYADLPGTATDEERTALLVRAGRIVSTAVIAPLPAVPALEAQIAALRATFDAELDNLRGLRDGAMRAGATLADLTNFIPAYETIDQTPIDLAPFRTSLLALAQDLLQKAQFLRDDVDRRVTEANAALARAAAAAGDKAQAAATDAAKAILGDGFVVLPEFTLSADRLLEWDNAWTNRAALLAHLARPFPLDDWRIGVARVRERVRHLETATLLAEALGAADVPSLDAVQFPFRTDDVWLGLELPATFPNGEPFVLEEDKLLYSPHFGPGAEIDPADANRTYSGLLIDEWVEVIPVDQVTTGLAFHFDRPNSEPPQAILLATPPAHGGSWRWDDLVATLHETLDLARLRAVEPAQLDRTALGPLLPAVISAVTLYPITATLNYASNNGVHRTLAEGS